MHHNVEIPMLAVKDVFMTVVADGKDAPADQQGGHAHFKTLAAMAKNPLKADQFYADGKATPAQLCGWVRSGFKATAMESGAAYVAVAEKKRRKFDEFDGDLDLERLFSGETSYFVKTEKRAVKPGLKLNIGMNFMYNVKADTIAAYGGWIAAFASGLEQRGFDLEVNVTSKTRGAYVGDSNGIVNFALKVKRSGEQSAFSTWSCLFAPGAYRSIMWTGEMMAARKVGKRMSEGMGGAVTPNGWAVNFDAATNTITLDCDGNARSFDGEKMTADAKKHKLI